jgi:hypothetical protein
MSVSQNILIERSVAGSIFPTTERELLLPVLVDGTSEGVVVEGGLYGRSLEFRGTVTVRGPVVARGDSRLEPKQGRLAFGSGVTVNGTLNTVAEPDSATCQDALQNANVIVKGDLAINQNIALRNAIVLGSIRAVNCFLENSVVLGTCIVAEKLRVAMSAIGGYASREVSFEGACTLIHALGESNARPLFLPYEDFIGAVVDSDIRYYPAIREEFGFVNRSYDPGRAYPEYSKLVPDADWVQVRARPNVALDEEGDELREKWVLSIGGRIGDVSRIANAIVSLTKMLKCGFEFEHYHPYQRSRFLKAAVESLTEEERWILETVCVVI